MAHNREGQIWDNVTDGANRRYGPGKDYPVIDTLPAGQPVIVLCYTLGETESFTNPFGHVNTSSAWDYVVTSDRDEGGFVADVLVNTSGNIIDQLGEQGTCELLRFRLESPTDSNAAPAAG